MKHKVKVNNPLDFHVGMRIKIPLGGWWFGSNKRKEWVKGKITKIGEVRKDGKIHSIITHCYSKKYGTIGRIMSLNEQCDEFYKVK